MEPYLPGTAQLTVPRDVPPATYLTENERQRGQERAEQRLTVWTVRESELFRIHRAVGDGGQESRHNTAPPHWTLHVVAAVEEGLRLLLGTVILSSLSPRAEDALA